MEKLDKEKSSTETKLRKTKIQLASQETEFRALKDLLNEKEVTVKTFNNKMKQLKVRNRD